MSGFACVCCNALLQKTEVTYKLLDVLQKWEEHGIKFSNKTWSDYSDNPTVTLFQCYHCGHGVFLPVVVGSESFYTDITRHEYYLADRWDFHIALKALSANKMHQILDIGCGRGAFLQLVAKQLPTVLCYGIDANPSVQGVLASGIKVYERVEDAPDNLDAITLFQVIEHVADPIPLLKQSIEKLKLGGKLVVSVPDHNGPIRFFADSHTAIPPHHVSIWTPSSLDALLNQFGLRILDRKWEPLPDYLMSAYLPKIISHKLAFFKSALWQKAVQRFIANPITHACGALKFRSIPLRGHTYLVVAQKDGRP